MYQAGAKAGRGRGEERDGKEGVWERVGGRVWRTAERASGVGGGKERDGVGAPAGWGQCKIGCQKSCRSRRVQVTKLWVACRFLHEAKAQILAYHCLELVFYQRHEGVRGQVAGRSKGGGPYMRPGRGGREGGGREGRGGEAEVKSLAGGGITYRGNLETEVRSGCVKGCKQKISGEGQGSESKGMVVK